MLKSFAALFPAITWKRGTVPTELSDVVKEICGQSVESAYWFLLAVCPGWDNSVVRASSCYTKVVDSITGPGTYKKRPMMYK